jgi:hypothetical protein
MQHFGFAEAEHPKAPSRISRFGASQLVRGSTEAHSRPHLALPVATLGADACGAHTAIENGLDASQSDPRERSLSDCRQECFQPSRPSGVEPAPPPV